MDWPTAANELGSLKSKIAGRSTVRDADVGRSGTYGHRRYSCPEERKVEFIVCLFGGL
jgi:hypothetical protein